MEIKEKISNVQARQRVLVLLGIHVLLGHPRSKDKMPE